MADDERTNAEKRLLILVCSYNEGGNLPTLLQALQIVAPKSDILLIDDGSTDNTYSWLEQHQSRFPQLTVRNRGKKLGLGTAIRDGLLHSIENGYELCLNLDADLSHDPNAIPQLLDKMNDDTDLVIGSRFIAGGGFENCSWRRKFVSRSVNRLARLLIGWPFRDCSSAYRCYRVAFLKQLNIRDIENASYGFLEEILSKIWRAGGTIKEVPIVYTERERGESKISLKEAYCTLKTLVRIRRN